MVPEGGDFIFSQALSPQSAIARLPGGAASMLRVNSFDIKYREDGSTEQFLSDLSVFDWQGVERLRKTISVNDPLRWKVCRTNAESCQNACISIDAGEFQGSCQVAEGLNVCKQACATSAEVRCKGVCRGQREDMGNFHSGRASERQPEGAAAPRRLCRCQGLSDSSALQR